MEINYRKIRNPNIESLAKKYEKTVEDKQYDYNPFDVKQVELYNPIYADFFVLNETNYNRIGLNHKHYLEVDRIAPDDKKYHIKCSPLLDPVHYLVGKYESSNKVFGLPSVLEKLDIHPKILNKQNASYVDGFFCYLSSQMLHKHNMLNAVDFYGSFLAIQNQFKFNITDDVDYLYQSHFFKDNIGKKYSVSCNASTRNFDDFTGIGSRSNKKRLIVEDDLDLGELVVDEIFAELSAEDEKYSGELCSQEFGKEKEEPVSEVYTKSEEESSDDNSSEGDDDLNYSSSSSSSAAELSEDETGSTDLSSFESGDEAFAYIKDFPANLIFLEKCDGTLDDLFMQKEIDISKGSACLMQIIMSLIALQKAFQFTHNDLHTNNIMYVNTDIEWLYYKYANQFYRVPTYGKIFKIIDFGRSIYRFKDKIYCSDSFASKGDAYSQYNSEPYFNSKKARIEPNPSFDLCRLGTSIYDFVIEDETEDRDELQETIFRWCLDDNAKNIMYKRDGEERYPGFKLYKMIARNVHAHTPQAQLKHAMFSQFLVPPEEAKKLDESEVRLHGLNIDLVEKEYL